jgi:dihydropteroate synthase-like protein
MRILIVVPKGEASFFNELSEVADLLEIPGSPAFWTLDTLRDNLRKINLKNYDVVVVPGSFPEDLTELSKELGISIVKGPSSPVLFKIIVKDKLLEVKEFDSRRPFEKKFQELTARINLMLLEELKKKPPAGVSFEIKNLKVPLRPPPILVMSEVYLCSEEDITKVRNRLAEGADIVVLGRSLKCKEEEYVRYFKKVIDEIDKPVAVDPGSLNLLIKLLNLGADIGMSLTIDDLNRIPPKLRKERAFVLIPTDIQHPVSELIKAEKRARSLGFKKLIIDPVVLPPVVPGTLKGLLSLLELSKRSSSPLLYGLCNVVELLDGDSTGVTLFASALALEAGASILLVVEGSPKTVWNTLEARIATSMVSLAKVLKVPPKDIYPFSLLAFKSKELRLNNKIVVNVYYTKSECENVLRSLSSAFSTKNASALQHFKEVLSLCEPLLLKS